MSERKAEQDASDSDSDPSVPVISNTVVPVASSEICNCMDELVLVTDVVQSMLESIIISIFVSDNNFF